MAKEKKLMAANDILRNLRLAPAIAIPSNPTRRTWLPSAILIEPQVMMKGTSAIDSANLRYLGCSLCSGLSYRPFRFRC